MSLWPPRFLCSVSNDCHLWLCSQDNISSIGSESCTLWQINFEGHISLQGEIFRSELLLYLLLNRLLKDPDTLSGFAQNKIISEILYLAWFDDKQSKGPFSASTSTRSLLKPLPWSLRWSVHFLYHHILFLHFWQIDFCLHEWSTGAFLQATLFEKDVIHTHKIYRVEVEAWSAINLSVTSNIRKKLFTRALYVHCSIPSPRFDPFALS